MIKDIAYYFNNSSTYEFTELALTIMLEMENLPYEMIVLKS